MKKLIFLELIFLFLATTFSSNPPPAGWYQQTLPVNDFINDIFFLDSLNGWVVTKNNGYVLYTSNGGNNWSVQLDSAGDLQAVQFLDNLTGYVLGNGLHGVIYKTTNGGKNWNLIHDFNPTVFFRDISFINNYTGWVCSRDNFDGGVFKTTDGGMSWDHQLNYAFENPQSIFFINTNIGWISSENRKIFKTTNGGINWNLQFINSHNLGSIFFLNENTGWVGSSGILKTTNGGVNWNTSITEVVGYKLDFTSDSIGWGGVDFFLISKTTNGGYSWFYQSSPIVNNTSVSSVDSLKAWAGASGIVHTTDGGGLSSINPISNQLPSDFILYQNYPNPFNPVTKISYELKHSRFAILRIFDAAGKEVQKLVNSNQDAGEYKIEINGATLPSGAYFYQLEMIDNKSVQAFSEAKKMLLVK